MRENKHIWMSKSDNRSNLQSTVKITSDASLLYSAIGNRFLPFSLFPENRFLWGSAETYSIFAFSVPRYWPWVFLKPSTTGTDYNIS